MDVRSFRLDELQPSNGGLAVRQGNDETGIKELAANIEVFGLIQPLLVKETGKGVVIVEGNRRWRALKLLKDPPARVDCIVDPTAGVGHALSANTMRADMNPMDRYDAFSKLVAAGHAPLELARAFGVKLRHVEQILALAALAPSIKDKVRAGKVSEDTAEALTLVRDHVLQEKLLKSCGDSDYRIVEAIRNGKPLLRNALFDKEQYKIAGGALAIDLFEGPMDVEGICLDDAVFWKLQNEAIKERVGALQKEGWKDVVKFDGKMARAAYNWPALRDVKKADRGKHTLRYSVEPDGGFNLSDYAEPDKPAKRVAAKAAEKNHTTPAARPESFAGDGVRAFPQALTAELAYQRGCQVKEAIVTGARLLGLRALVYMLIIKQKNSDRAYIAGPGDLAWSGSVVEDVDDEMPGFVAAETAYDKIAKLPPAQIWDRLAKCSQVELTELLTYVSAAVFDGKMLGSWDLGRRILAEKPIDGRNTFIPDAIFWAQTSKGYMMAQLAAVCGKSLTADAKASLAAMKAGDLAELLGRWFTAPEKITSHQLGGTNGGTAAANLPKTIPVELQKKFKAWVPHALELPTEAEARKGHRDPDFEEDKR